MKKPTDMMCCHFKGRFRQEEPVLKELCVEYESLQVQFSQPTSKFTSEFTSKFTTKSFLLVNFKVK